MKRTVFTGAATALITPMKNGGIDYERFSEVVEFQIAHKIDVLLYAESTGESPLLPDCRAL